MVWDGVSCGLRGEEFSDGWPDGWCVVALLKVGLRSDSGSGFDSSGSAGSGVSDFVENEM